MEFLLEAILEGILQLVLELVGGSVDYLLVKALGDKLAAKVRLSFHSLLLAFFGWLGAKVSITVLPMPFGDAEPQIWYYCLALPLVVSFGLFAFVSSLKKFEAIKRERMTISVAWLCCVLTFSFSISRYLLLMQR